MGIYFYQILGGVVSIQALSVVYGVHLSALEIKLNLKKSESVIFFFLKLDRE